MLCRLFARRLPDLTDEAFHQGLQCGLSNLESSDNPYRPGEDAYEAWHAGFLKGLLEE